MRFNFKYHSQFSDCILLNSILKYHGIQCGNRIKYEKKTKKLWVVYGQNIIDSDIDVPVCETDMLPSR